MEKFLTGQRSSDLRQRLNKITGNFQSQAAKSQMVNLRIHMKVLKCLDDLESTMSYSNYTAI